MFPAAKANNTKSQQARVTLQIKLILVAQCIYQAYLNSLKIMVLRAFLPVNIGNLYISLQNLLRSSGNSYATMPSSLLKLIVNKLRAICLG
jgi:transposase-like protein